MCIYTYTHIYIYIVRLHRSLFYLILSLLTRVHTTVRRGHTVTKASPTRTRAKMKSSESLYVAPIYLYRGEREGEGGRERETCASHAIPPQPHTQGFAYAREYAQQVRMQVFQYLGASICTRIDAHVLILCVRACVRACVSYVHIHTLHVQVRECTLIVWPLMKMRALKDGSGEYTYTRRHTHAVARKYLRQIHTLSLTHTNTPITCNHNCTPTRTRTCTRARTHTHTHTHTQ